MRTMIAVALVAAAATAQAQGVSPSHRFDLRVPSGGFVATGTQRDVLKDGKATAVQMSWLVRPKLAMVGTFTWARSRDLATVGSPKLDVFSSDLGIESRPAAWGTNRKVSLVPIVGVGAGARSYNYRSLDANATHNMAAYAAAGGEVGIGRANVRLEMRDYVSGFRPLMGRGESSARNDMMFLVGVRMNRKHAAQGE